MNMFMNMFNRDRLTNFDDIKKEITISEISAELSECSTVAEYREVMINILQNKSITGAANDFHNLSVDLSRKDLFELSCNVLEIGLSMQRYSNNVDLLADVLVYGIKCNKEDICERAYNALLHIPKCRWKWRAFDFTVDYLMQKAENILDYDKLMLAKKEMLDLTSSYRRFFPDSEGSYIVESQIHRFVNDVAKEEEVLLKGFTIIKRAPQISLRLADIAFERGEYDKARTYLKYAKISGIGKDNSINIYYVYYLDAVCLIIILLSKEKICKEDVNELYGMYAEMEDFFDSAESDFRGIGDYLNVIEPQIHIFEKRTGYIYDKKNYDGNRELNNFDKNSFSDNI